MSMLCVWLNSCSCPEIVLGSSDSRPTDHLPGPWERADLTLLPAWGCGPSLQYSPDNVTGPVKSQEELGFRTQWKCLVHGDGQWPLWVLLLFLGRRLFLVKAKLKKDLGPSPHTAPAQTFLGFAAFLLIHEAEASWLRTVTKEDVQ